MRRDGLSAGKADFLIKEAKLTLQEYLENGELEYAEDICQELFGLEPDYIFDLI